MNNQSIKLIFVSAIASLLLLSLYPSSLTITTFDANPLTIVIRSPDVNLSLKDYDAIIDKTYGEAIGTVYIQRTLEPVKKYIERRTPLPPQITISAEHIANERTKKRASFSIGTAAFLANVNQSIKNLADRAHYIIGLDYDGLFDDLKRYKTTSRLHAGNLFEHSVWAGKAMHQFFEKKASWTEGVDPSYRRFLIVAAFLHDIGKAGDRKFNYHNKPTHPRDGFEYIMHDITTHKNRYKQYIKADNKPFNFKNYFDYMGLSYEERIIIAILIGMHYDFGTISSNIRGGPSREKQFSWFLERLRTYVKETNYNSGIIDEKILRMTILSNVADVKGMGYIKDIIYDLPDIPDDCPVPADHMDRANVKMYDQWKIDANDSLRKQLIDYWKNHWRTTRF